jgi:transportin-1
MNCLVAVAQNAGPAFEDFAPSCFQRSCSIITAQLQATATGAPERSEAAIMVALDLITGLAEGLGASMDALIAASPPGGSPHLRLLLVECCRDKCPEIRQSAFALVGDLAKVPPSLPPPSFSLTLDLSYLTLCAHT